MPRISPRLSSSSLSAYRFKYYCHETTKAPREEVPVPELIEGNGSAASMKNSNSIRYAIPQKLSIRTDERGRILISTISGNWKLNAKAQKPYHRDFQITVVVNTASGMTYVMPAMWRGKPVFPGEEKPQTSALAYNMILEYISEKFFEKDEEAMKALREEFLRLRPATADGKINSLVDLARANYLDELCPYFHNEKSYLGYAEEYMWKHLRRRQRKDPATFPAYLTHGCRKVATKSIKKIIYKQPEHKWTLLFLYKALGITNPDVLRSLLTVKAKQTAETARYWLRGGTRTKKQIRSLADTLSAVGMSDKQKAEFIFPGENLSYYNISDSARMLEIHENLTSEQIRTCRNIRELHDALVAIDNENRDKALMERYSAEVTYDSRIIALEETCENAEFRIMRRPWDQKSLGEKLHNCLRHGLYMEAAKEKRSIIIEMLLNGKTAASIELDGKGKLCRQAFAACNNPLQGDAKELFGQWAEKHGINTETAKGYCII